MASSTDFGEDLLREFATLKYVSTPHGKPDTTIEQWELQLLMHTLYVLSIDGDVIEWSDDPSIFNYYQSEGYDCIVMQPAA